MKNWTRPKIKVQKFVPNSCIAACYTNFIEGEAWFEDDFKEHGKWDGEGNDFYNSNWTKPSKDPYPYEGWTGSAWQGFTRYPGSKYNPQEGEDWDDLTTAGFGRETPAVVTIQFPSGQEKQIFYLIPSVNPQYVAMTQTNAS